MGSGNGWLSRLNGAEVVEKVVFLLLIGLVGESTMYELVLRVNLVAHEYGAMIDAGSSGSRMRVFRWRRSELSTLESVELTGYECEDVEPGISSFVDNIDRAVATIAPLLACAENHIPRGQHASSKIFLRATAGVRMLPDAVQSVFLSEFGKAMCRVAVFECDPSHFTVLSGKEEGAYLWLGINHLLRAFPRRGHALELQVGVLDMGGGSTQIAAPLADPEAAYADEMYQDNIVRISVPGYVQPQLVFSTSILGGGMNVAERDLREDLAHWARGKEANNNVSASMRINDPCSNKGRTYTHTFRSQFANAKNVVQFIGTGDISKCNELVSNAISKVARCDGTRTHHLSIYGSPRSDSYDNVERWRGCIFRGNSIPPLGSRSFYAVSNYFYVARFFHLGETPSIAELRTAAEAYCALEWAQIEQYAAEAKQEPFDAYCFRALYLSEFLEAGLGFDKNSHLGVHFVHKLNHSPADWSTGAMLVAMGTYVREEDWIGRPQRSMLSLLLLVGLFVHRFVRRSGLVKEKNSPRAARIQDRDADELLPFVA